MKTYIAEGVLCDWTCGLFVVSARGMKHAKKIVDKLNIDFVSDNVKEDIKSKLRLLKAGDCIYTYGGS